MRGSAGTVTLVWHCEAQQAGCVTFRGSAGKTCDILAKPQDLRILAIPQPPSPSSTNGNTGVCLVGLANEHRIYDWLASEMAGRLSQPLVNLSYDWLA